MRAPSSHEFENQPFPAPAKPSVTLPSGAPFVTVGVTAFPLPHFAFGVAKNGPCYRATLALLTVVLTKEGP